MLLWGVLPLALREMLLSLDPTTLTAFRFAVSAAALGAVLAMRGALPVRAQLTRQTGVLLGVATLGLAANYIAFLLGLARTSPANAQVLIQLGPLLLALGGIVVFRERFSTSQWIGTALLALGLGLFFRSQLAAMGREPERYLAGVAWIGFAAATWAIYGLAQKQLLHGISSQAVMLCIFVGCALVFIPTANPRALLALTPLAWGVLAFCTVNTLIAYGAFAAALEHEEASRVSAVIAITPLATVAFSALASTLFPHHFVAEHLGIASWIGAGVVVVGSLLTALGRREIAEIASVPVEPVALRSE